ncbi:MAG: ribose 5-phosphate isomerase B [Elusimicrobia bacterium HGW-Elusimicrobia-3]|jgi:ribose 5-phosphate isomerase B|nr:MAG: ribose 5-phosphate isomerase B [Elusimicrobia bacterium HGW-Elusimicrobia-3]
MKIAIAGDHAGYTLKAALLPHLRALGHEAADLGTDSPDKAVDYPDFAAAVAREVVAGRAERGIVVCGSGVGACVAANKVRGVRAGLCHDTYSAHQGVEHDDMNVLCLGARIIGQSLAFEIVAAFASARFSDEERHKRRLKKVEDLERGV